MITVHNEQNNYTLLKSSSNYIKKLECYEVELIRNTDRNADTSYRIELIDNNYLDITIGELKALKAILNNKTVTYLLNLGE